MSVPQLTLTARVNPSAADARRGIVRVHPEVLAALSLREWDAVSIVGARRTAAVVAGAPDIATGTVLLDDITFSNAGIREDSAVVLQPVTVHGAAQVVVSGSVLASRSVDQATLRRALLGKVLSVGDAVSLLPRDLGPDLTASTAVRALIKQFVSAENAKKPLSDSQIAEMLKEQGIECARRTVAKYREALKIAPANLRKAL